MTHRRPPNILFLLFNMLSIHTECAFLFCSHFSYCDICLSCEPAPMDKQHREKINPIFFQQPIRVNLRPKHGFHLILSVLGISRAKNTTLKIACRAQIFRQSLWRSFSSEIWTFGSQQACFCSPLALLYILSSTTGFANLSGAFSSNIFQF